MAVTVINRQRRPLSLPRLKRAVAAAGRLEGRPGAEVAILLGGDSLIARLNAQHRGIASPTDVLSFPAAAGEKDWPSVGANRAILGDVVISTQTAARQARQQGHSLDREVALLALHGLLHLLGWRDDTPPRLRRMQARVEELMNQLWKEPR